MPKDEILVKFYGEKGVDHKFVSRCPRMKYREDEYMPLSARLADERFNQSALNNMRRIG